VEAAVQTPEDAGSKDAVDHTLDAEAHSRKPASAQQQELKESQETQSSFHTRQLAACKGKGKVLQHAG